MATTVAALCWMIAAYMDESFDTAKKGVFAVGGLMGRGVPFFELERYWENLRRRPDIDIEFFKASECEHGAGEFAKFVADPDNITSEERKRLDSISHEFLSLIPKAEYLLVHGVGVVQPDFYEIIADSNARSILGENPYRLAYDLAMVQCAWAMKNLGTGDCVSFVCDEHETYSPFAHEAYQNLGRENPEASKYMGTFTSKNDKNCEPLQAADAAVFEIRRALNYALGQWQTSLRKQFNLLADAKRVFLIQHANRKNLLHIVGTHQPGEPFKLSEVMDQQFDEDIRI